MKRYLLPSGLSLAIFFSVLSKASCGKDIVFILDRSSDVLQPDFLKAISFIHSVTSLLDIGVHDNQISILTYSENITEVFNLKAYHDKTKLLAAIQNIKHSRDIGNRDTHKSLAFVREKSFLASHGARDHVGKAVVLITHGVSYVPFAIRESSSLKNTGAELFTIGIGSAAVDGLEEMQAVSSDPDSKYVYTLLSFDDLSSIAKGLAEKLKAEHIITKPVHIKHLDVSIVAIIVVFSLFFLITIVVIMYAVLRKCHRKEIMAIRRQRKCNTCNTMHGVGHPVCSGTRLRETDNSSVPNSLTDSTDDTGYIGSDQPNSVSILVQNDVTARKASRQKKGKRSRTSIRPGPVISLPNTTEDMQLSVEVRDAKENVVVYDMPKKSVDRREKFITKRKSQIKLRKSSVGPGSTTFKAEVPWCDSFAYPAPGLPLSVPAISGRTALFQVIPAQ